MIQTQCDSSALRRLIECRNPHYLEAPSYHECWTRHSHWSAWMTFGLEFATVEHFASKHFQHSVSVLELLMRFQAAWLQPPDQPRPCWLPQEHSRVLTDCQPSNYSRSALSWWCRCLCPWLPYLRLESEFGLEVPSLFEFVFLQHLFPEFILRILFHLELSIALCLSIPWLVWSFVAQLPP